MTKIGNGTKPPKNVYEYFESIKDNSAALRQFFTAMPKGGDLHNHLTGSAYAETYFELAVKHGMYVDMETGKLYKEQPEGIEVIQLFKKMDNLHNHRMALIDKWSIRNFQPYKYPLGPDEYFFGTFGLLSALTSIPGYKDEFCLDNLAHLLHELKVRAVRENVQYLEVMACSPIVQDDCYLANYEGFDKKLKECVEKGDYKEARSVLKSIIEIYKESSIIDEAEKSYRFFIAELDRRSNKLDNHLNIDIANVKCRYQGYASRGGEPLKVFAQLYVIHQACKNSTDHLLVGCNIVAAENGEKSMMYYQLHMEMFAVLADEFSSVKTSLHAGELTMGLVRPEHLTYHINHAVNIAKANRIGHGVDLPFEQDSDELLRTMKKGKRIPVEINLTSNEFILGVKGTEHPIRLYHKAGVPIIISTDDPGILRTSLTEQYTLATLRYGFNYDEIHKIVINSIDHSFIDPTEKWADVDALIISLSEFEKKYVNQSLSAEAEREENES